MKIDSVSQDQVMGNELYCKWRNLKNCVAMYSRQGYSWRIQSITNFGVKLKLSDWYEDIYCYGEEEIMVYPFKETETKELCKNWN